MHSYLNQDNTDLNEIAIKYAKDYQQGNPFPNISLDNFFNPEILDKVIAEFPDMSKKDAILHNSPVEKKLAGKGEAFFGEATKKFMHFLNSEAFLGFLQILTGIKEPLLSDPYFSGGGQHEIKRDGFLKIHADFNKHPSTKLDRRINVLIYLNKSWKEEYGGHFELWDTEMTACKKKILPTYNTMAIFSTTDFSYHGHPDPLKCPEGMSRKSLALYYYSNGRPAEEISPKSHDTLFQARKTSQADKVAFAENDRFKTKQLLKDCVPPIIWKAVRSMKK